MRYGDRVRLRKSYEMVDEPKAGAEGEVTFVWDDGQCAVKFDKYEWEWAYWPKDLERLGATASPSTESKGRTTP